MSAAFASAPEVDASIAADGAHVVVRFRDGVTVALAAAVRRFVADELAGLPSHGSAIVDLSEVTELDAAGLAAVTAPVFAARRRGRRVTVLPPATGPARRLTDTVGVLPIGIG